MDDIIVIILTLIFIVAGIFGQMKKKPPVPQPQTEPLSAEDDFWDMLDADREEIRPKVDEQGPSKIRMEKMPSSGNKYEFKPENERNRKTIRDRIEQNEVKNRKQTDRKRKFPLKEAVIYSEILHRKYI
jgi:hypothetical protein